jgi:hypothetical protein
VDHIIVLGEMHLRRFLKSYAGYYNGIRTHRSLDKDAPATRQIQRIGSIKSHAILGGFHHHYRPQQSQHRLLTPERLTSVLEILADRQSAKTDAVDRRLVSLQREVSDTEERLRRLYRSIEDGIVELDDILRERTTSLKSERERAKAAYDRARAQCGTVAMIDSVKIDAFARLMTDKLDNGDINARKGYIRSIVDAIEVDDNAIRIIGSKNVLQAVIAGKQTANGNVRGFVRKWRARRDSNSCCQIRNLGQNIAIIEDRYHNEAGVEQK